MYGTAPTCYLSALARVPSFKIGDLDQAIETDRSVVRARLMRGSVYTLPSDLLVVASAATRDDLLKSYRSMAKRIDANYAAASAAVEEALGGGPRASREIRARVDPEKHLGSAFAILLARMAAECRIVRATTTGGWRSNRLSYALWNDWLPGVDPAAIPASDARRELARRYVAAYGPVELDDLCWWTGWSVTAAEEAADGLNLSASGSAMELLAGVRLLPVWDVLMVAYRHRDRVLDPDAARFVYDRFGNATSVVIDHGRVVGIWDLGRSDDPLNLKVAPLGTWRQDRWEAVQEQAERIRDLIGAGEVTIERIPDPTDLLEAPRNRFLSPMAEGK